MEEVEKKKPGPAAKPKVEFEDYAALKKKVDALELVIATMAHQTGIPNALFINNDLQHYELKPKDLRKFAS